MASKQEVGMMMVQVPGEGAEDSSSFCREAAGDGPSHAPDVLLPLPASPPPPPPGQDPFSPTHLLPSLSIPCQCSLKHCS